jgi:mono/diheme cytochrome c family protein/heme/copper-type cytochrome/quinol oxidase subunit 4
MANDHKHGGVGTYVIVALILGVITYLEFALVEYPQAWLGSGWTVFWLVALSVAKFVMVIMFFMHLKEDDRTYTGFFSSGMFIALGTFIAMTAMFILPRAVATTRPAVESPTGVAAHGDAPAHGAVELPADVAENIATDGRSRPAAEAADSPRPKDRSVEIVPPAASNDASTYDVALDTPALAATPDAATETAPDGAAADAADAAADAAAAAGEPEPDAPADATPPSEPAAEAAAWDEEMGAQAFTSTCSACHQANGQGIPGAFPPLAGHTAEIYQAGGREYLVQVVLFGLQGPITVDGMAYAGVMPPWANLSDAQIANALNHTLTAWSDAPADFAPILPEEVAALRGAGLTSNDVYAARQELGLP